MEDDREPARPPVRRELVTARSRARNACSVKNGEPPEDCVAQSIEEISEEWLCEEPDDEWNGPWVLI